MTLPMIPLHPAHPNHQDDPGPHSRLTPNPHPQDRPYSKTADNGRIRYDPGDPHRKSSWTFSKMSTVRQRSNTFNNPQTPTYHRPRPTMADSASTQLVPGDPRLLFANLGTSPSPRKPLIAEEKAEIWDDLPERIDCAGGTIHLWGQEPLMSELNRGY